MQLLISKGAAIGVRDKGGGTPAQYARDNGFTEVFKLASDGSLPRLASFGRSPPSQRVNSAPPPKPPAPAEESLTLLSVGNEDFEIEIE